jgi:hypothetical protein
MRVRLAVEVLGTYVVTQWWLRRRGLPTAVRLARAVTFEPDPLAEKGSAACGVRLGNAVARVLGALPTDTRCLARSLVLMRLLARRGVPASLVIGVATEPEFGAHAWVEHGGRPLLPAGGGRFERLLEL